MLNKRSIIPILVLCSLSFVLTSSGALAQGQAQSSGIYHVANWETFEAKWLIGREVWSPSGMKLGEISNFVIDQENERVALVFLSAVPNLGRKPLPIPFSALTKTGENEFRLGFHDRELTDLSSSSDLYEIPSRIDPGWVAKIYARYGQDAYWTKPGQKPLSSMGLYTADKLMEAEIRLSTGPKVAQVSNLVIDASNGHVVFLTLSGVEGKGTGLVAFPLSLLSKENGNVFALLTEQSLVDAPSFHGFTDMASRKYALDVYEFFGLQPYWTE
jgi:sporulation protein YlmC with PRC-barrel domain